MSRPMRKLANFTFPDLLVSTVAPLDWTVRRAEDGRWVVAGEADRNGDRPTATFAAVEPKQPGMKWFRTFCSAVPAALANAPGFELHSTDEFRISSQAEVFSVRARQFVPGGVPTAQLRGYIWVNSSRMYLLDAITLVSREKRDLPIFETMLYALRVFPPRPDRD